MHNVFRKNHPKYIKLTFGESDQHELLDEDVNFDAAVEDENGVDINNLNLI